MNANYKFSEEIIEKFRTKFDFSLTSYVDDYFFFVKFQYPEIVNFYVGNLERAEQSFNSLNELLLKSQVLNNLLREIKSDFKTYEDWEFIDYITDMHEKLLTMSKIYKFVRSGKVKSNYSSEMIHDYNLGYGESLEKVARLQLGSDSFDNDWIQIARDNSLSELDYDSKSGNRIILSVKLNSQSLGITSIVDSVEGAKVLGLDIRRKVTFNDNDLDVLSYSDTFYQSVEILLNLMKEDIPEFPSIGRTAIIGSNSNVLGFNSTIRELTETVSSDDSIIDFTILGIENDFNSGTIHIKCELRSRLDLITTNKTFVA